MVRRFAEAGSGRIAVLGAAGAAGAQVKTALTDHGVPGSRVDLYGGDGEVAVLSEYDGEARLVRPSVELEPGSHAAVFVCEGGHDAGSLVAASRNGTLVLDLSGTIEGAVLAGVTAAAEARLVSIPHVVTAVLGAVLTPIHARFVLKSVSAFVTRPASDFGRAGLEELREQTIHLLRFETAPTDVFGRQLAFNVVPEHLFPAPEERSSERVTGELRALLGTSELPVAVSQALVPTFLAHAAALHFEVARGSAAELSDALRSAPGVSVAAAGDDAGATMDAPEGPDVQVSRIVPGGPNAFRAWAVAADAGPLAGARAVAVAAAAGIL